jgi:filamentous hemagglutinin family protein
MIRHQYRPVLGVRQYLATVLATMLLWASPVFALPSTPVIAGANGTGIAATFDTSIPNSLTVNQNGANTRVVIDWNSFNIASGEHVTFSQPSKSSIAFNVVPASAGVTNIAGSLSANGGVWLFSPGGILFGSGAVVNTGSFLASTGIFSTVSQTEALGSSNEIQIFAQATPGAASITVPSGATIGATAGFVLLHAPTITQNGSVSATDAVVYNADEDIANAGGVTILPSASGVALVDEQSFSGGPAASHIVHGGTSTAGTWFEVDAAEDVTTAPGFGGVINLGGHVTASGMKATGNPNDTGNGYSVILDGDAAGNDTNREVTTLDGSAGAINAASGIYANAGTIKTGLWTNNGGEVSVTGGDTGGVEIDQALVSTGAGPVLIGGSKSVAINADVTAAHSAVIGSAGSIQVAPNVTIQAGATAAGSSLTILSTGSLFVDPTSSLLVGSSVAAPNGALNISVGGTIDVASVPEFNLSQTLVGHGGDLTLGSAVAGSISLAATSLNNVGGAINIPGAISAPGEISLDAAGGANVTGSITAGGSVFIAAGQLALGPNGGISAGASSPVGGGTIATSSAAGNVITQNSATSGLVPTALPPAVGDISIGAPMTWSNSSTLTLNAYHSIVVSAPITDTASDSQVLLNTNQGGSGGDYSFVNGGSLSFIGGPSANQSLSIDGQAYTLIYSEADLLNINNDLTGFYALAGPLDFDTATTATVFTAAPIASLANNPFFGTFTGLGNTISNLTISDTTPIVQTVGPGYATNGQVGLFGTVGAGGVVRDVNLSNANVSGVDGMQVGALVGGLYGVVEDASSSGTVQVGSGVSTWAGYAHAEAGGLVGGDVGTIANSQSSANVSAGDGFAGGLAGVAAAGAGISGSSASGNVSVAGYSGVTGDDAPEAGGLVGLVFGFQFDGTIAPVNIAGSFATGNVSGGSGTFVGGFAGLIDQGLVTTSYATGSVTQTAAPTTVNQNNFAGGFAGAAVNSSTVTQSYASGAVTSVSGGTAGGPYALAGGFVGDMDTGSTISQAYALGAVTVTGGGANDAGGFVGVILGGSSADHIYATGHVSGTGAQAGLVGVLGDTSNPTHTAGFVSNSYWDSATTGQANGVNIVATTGSTATNVNSVSGASAYATASYGNFDLTNVWFMIPGETRPILRSEYSTTITDAHQLQLMSLHLGADYTLANDIDASEATRASGVWNTANGFVPVGGNSQAAFTGTLDGAGHTISNLFINYSTIVPQTGPAGFPVNGYAGLFGVVGAGGVVQDINLSNVNVTAADKMFAGALVGSDRGDVDHATSSGVVAAGATDNTTTPVTYAGAGGLIGNVGLGGALSNSSSSATVTGGAGGGIAGGLVGALVSGGSISNSFATGNVSVAASTSTTIDGEAGGLVGAVYGYTDAAASNPDVASISGSYATGAVSGGSSSAIGGFAGVVTNGQIITSHATGSVTQAAAPVVGGEVNLAGGFAGYIKSNSVVTQSYASGAVNTVGGTDANHYSFAGGFAGDVDLSASVSDSYSLGAVTSTGSSFSSIGGFAGLVLNSTASTDNATIESVYATGHVTGAGIVGGLIGLVESGGQISNSYWDEGTTGQTTGFTVLSGGVETAINPVGGASGHSAYDPTSYANFDLANTWVMIASETRPVLRSEYSTTITNAHQLQLMGLNLGASYTLANDVNASETSSASGVWNPANGFVPVGATVAAPFAGSFNGQGHTISNLTIVDTSQVQQTLPTDQESDGAVGLFGFVGSSGVLENVTLANAKVTGGNGMEVGALAGDVAGLVANASSSGTVTVGDVDSEFGSDARAGGLVGELTGTIQNASSSAKVIGGDALVGGLLGESIGGTVTGSFATGMVNGGAGSDAGGFIGFGDSVTIDASYATGDVTQSTAGSNFAGGFAGDLEFSTVTRSFATGNVNTLGDDGNSAEAGGFVGNLLSTTVNNAYATGSVTATGPGDVVGGFAGAVGLASAVNNVYATGAVSGAEGATVGGLFGLVSDAPQPDLAEGAEPSVTNGYWDEGTTGQTNGYNTFGSPSITNITGIGDDTGNDPTNPATYFGFDYSIWSIPSDGFYPELYGVSHVLNITAQNTTITYGNFPIYTLTVTGLQGGDTVASAVQSFQVQPLDATTSTTSGFYNANVNDQADINAPYDLSISNVAASGATGAYRPIYNDNSNNFDGSLTVTPQLVTLSASGDERYYDGDVDSSAQPYIYGAMVPGDAIFGTEVYDGPDAGPHNLSIADYSVYDGNNGANYIVTVDSTPASGFIDPEPIEIDATSDTKQYDGGTSSSQAPFVASGLFFGDDGVTDLTQAFQSKDVLGEDGSTLLVTGYTLSNPGDYSVTTVSTPGTITPAPLTINAVTDSKQYDGGTSSSGTPTYDPSQVLGDDGVSGLSQAFDSKNVLGAGGSTLSVNGYTINDGNNGNDYTVTTTTAAGTITPAPLVLNATSDTKQYDGGTSSSAAPTADTLFGDDSLTATQSFASKNVLGEGLSTLSIDPGYAINDGNNGANYTVTQINTASGTITPAPLTASLVGTVDKTYDTTTAASLATGNYHLAGVIGTDDVSLNDPLSGTYDTKNAGTGKTVTVDNLAISGEDAANYTVNGSAAGAVGTIDRAPLTLSAVSDSKTYDGGVLSGGAPTYSGLLEGDNISNLVQSFDSRNAGSRTLLVTGYSIADGNSGGNYAVTTTTASGTINPAALTLTAIGADKTYDGTTASGATPGVAGLVSGDSLTAAQSYDSKNVGARTLAVTSYTISDGNGGGNYTVTTTTAAGTIDAKALTASLTGTVTKTFDGNTAASLADGNYALSGVVSSDDVSLNDPTGGTYDNPNAGTHKIVSVGGLALSGADAANYTVNGSAAGPVGTINAPPQTQQITVPVIDVTSSEFEAATASPAAAAAAASATATSATVVNVFPVAPANDQTPQGDNSPITGAGNRDLWTSSDESDKDCPKTGPCPPNAGSKP